MSSATLLAPYVEAHRFLVPYRVYYEDTDAAGVVYYANYLKYAERARTEWLRYLGVEQESLMREFGFGFVVSRANVTYKRPARLDDIVVVETHLQHCRKVRMSMRQLIRVGEVECATLDVEIACVDRNFSPTPLARALPTSILDQLSHFLQPATD